MNLRILLLSFILFGSHSLHAKSFLRDCYRALTSRLSSAQQEIYHKKSVEFAGEIIPLPLGVEEKAFVHFLHGILDINGFNGVIFWGSRTHFNWGYPPVESSDLDYMVLFSQYNYFDLMIMFGLARTFQSSTGVVPVNAFLNYNRVDILGRYPVNFRNQPLTVYDEQALYGKRSWFLYNSRKAMKAEFNYRFKQKYPDSLLLINREALIFLKPTQSNINMAQTLKSMGYQNVFLIE